jgi:hypothetical protein
VKYCILKKKKEEALMGNWDGEQSLETNISEFMGQRII